MFKPASLLALVSLVPAFVNAAQPIYAQCGGLTWTRHRRLSPPPRPQRLPQPRSQQQPAPAPAPDPPPPLPQPLAIPSLAIKYVLFQKSGYCPAKLIYAVKIYLTPFYANEVTAAAAAISDSTQKAKALKVASIPTFTWFDVIAKTSTLGTYLADASAKGKASGTKYLVQIVVYDLPDRDCAALASNGEFSIANDGLNKYKTYIDQLVAQIKQYPDVRVVAVIEPDSLANLVTNLNVSKCSGAQTAYKAGVTYAMQQLNTVGVYMYLDAGHAGWLGWSANLSPAAQLFTQLYKDAGSPSFVRGLATNVANYNALTAASPDPITQGNSNYDEIHYINALAPLLTSGGFPAHFIVDQGRSGVQNIRSQWGDWCNVLGAGFGTHPTLSTGSSLIDAIVWVKPGGECDGTSNTSAARYDAHCGLSDAAPNAPEAGTWFQSYFETLVKNANPAL
ncbi:Beta-glucosidase cel3A [Tephrocybe rancida]|nr:Beta-glucosidase cel3A [Tephrocybe rancida]